MIIYAIKIKEMNKIGYLMLITYLDKYGIIKNEIDKLLKNIMDDIFEKQ